MDFHKQPKLFWQALLVCPNPSNHTGYSLVAFQSSATAFSQDEVGVNQLLAELCHPRPRTEYQPLPVKTGPFREGMFLSPATRIKGWREVWALVRAVQLHRPSPWESHPWQGQLVVTAFPLWLRRSGWNRKGEKKKKKREAGRKSQD